MWVVGNKAMNLESSQHITEVSDCVLAIAREFLRNRCLAFLFPLNFTQPSVLSVPPLVRSGLLRNIHKSWAPNLPAANVHETYVPFPNPLPGALNHLHCAHIIILDEGSSFVYQIDQIIYTFYTNFYENGGGERTRMIVTTTEEVNETEVHRLLFHMYKMGDLDVVFIGMKFNVVSVFTLFPFGTDGGNCPENNSGIEILDFWRNKSFALGANLFPNKLPERFNNCVMSVSTVHYPPFMFLNFDNAPYNGIEFHILDTLTRHMGLTPNFTGYRRTDGWMWSEDGNVLGAMADLRRGQVWLMVAGTSSIVYNFPSLYVPHSYMSSQLSWFFQEPQKVPTWKLIYVAFSKLLWIFVLTTMAVFPYSLYLLGKLERSSAFLKEMSKCVTVSWSIAVGHSSSMHARTQVIRLVLAAWLFYSMHMNLAYTASLTGLITAGKMERRVTTFEQILELDLKTAINVYLTSQFSYMDEPAVKKVLSNYMLISGPLNRREVFSQMRKYRNVSILDVDTYLSYKIKKHKLLIYKSDLKICFYSTGILLRRNHFMVGRISELSSRICEGGISVKYVNDFTESSWKTSYKSVTLKAYNMKDLAGPFFILIIGYFLSFIIFFVELFNEVILKRILKKTIGVEY